MTRPINKTPCALCQKHRYKCNTSPPYMPGQCQRCTKKGIYCVIPPKKTSTTPKTQGGSDQKLTISIPHTVIHDLRGYGPTHEVGQATSPGQIGVEAPYNTSTAFTSNQQSSGNHSHCSQTYHDFEFQLGTPFVNTGEPPPTIVYNASRHHYDTIYPYPTPGSMNQTMMTSPAEYYQLPTIPVYGVSPGLGTRSSTASSSATLSNLGFAEAFTNSGEMSPSSATTPYDNPVFRPF